VEAQIKELTARVDAQKPADVAFGSPTRSTAAPAIARLAKRGVTEVIAVPFFLSTAIAPEDLTGYAVPVRSAPAANGDPIFADVILSRAQEISRNPAEEVLVLVGYGADDGGTSWAVDLAASAQQLNRLDRTQRFRSVLYIKRPESPTENEQQQIRLTLGREVDAGRRILVVRAMVPANGLDPALEQRLQGFSYEAATRGIMADDRLIQWLIARAPSSPR
jgi:sirohydrochlorin ferrochelatase